jgi:hypothetical protein
LRGDDPDPRVDRVTMGDDGFDQLAGEGGRGLIALGLGQVTLQDRLGGALAEVGLEDRGQRQSTSRPSSALAISLRHHRR